MLQKNAVQRIQINDEKLIEKNVRPILPDMLEGTLYGSFLGALIGVGSMTWVLYHEASMKFSNNHEGQSLSIFYWLTHINDRSWLPARGHADVPTLYLDALIYGSLVGASCIGPFVSLILY